MSSAHGKEMGKAEKSALQVVFTADAVTRVSRQTLKQLAEVLGVSETQTVHIALARLKQELAQAEGTGAGGGGDDDYPPLTATQLKAIRNQQPRRSKRGLIDSLIR